jgi:hypothetical protein
MYVVTVVVADKKKEATIFLRKTLTQSVSVLISSPLHQLE